MAQFPTALPTIPTASSNQTLATAAGIGHTALHTALEGEVEAIAAKIGIDASTPVAGTVLGGTGPGQSAWRSVDLSSDVTGVLPLNKGGTGGASAAAARSSLSLYSISEVDSIISAAQEALYPVGSVYVNATVDTNPSALLGFGTWTAFGAGRVLVGVDAGQAEFDNLGETGGAKTHTLTTAEMPAHTHTINTWTAGAGGGGEALSSNNTTASSAPSTSSTGGGGAHNNLQPYITVYMWRRTA